MCAPAIAIASLAIGAIGTGVAVHGQRQTAKYQEALNRQNAELAERAAGDAALRGQAEEARIRMETARFLGSQRTAIVAGGAELGPAIDEPGLYETSSAQRILEGTAVAGKHEALLASNNAMREAFGLQAQAGFFSSEAAFVRSSGRTAIGGTLLAGAGQGLSIYRSTFPQPNTGGTSD
jgi:hypothetical protein